MCFDFQRSLDTYASISYTMFRGDVMTSDNDGPRDRGYWLVAELAEAARLSGARIRQLLLAGRELKGNKAGQVWTIAYQEGDRWLKQRLND